jgi:hypothetical protein
MIPVAAGVALLAAAIAVRGESSCPAAGDVEARVRALLPASAADARNAAGVEARLERSPGRLRIALLRPDGALAGERIIEGDHGCDELAEAAAVVVASWASDERAALDPPALPVVPSLAARPAPAAAAVAAPAAPPARPALELGGGVGASLAGAAAPAGLLSASWAPGTGRRVAARLTGLLTGTRDLTLPGGSARWRRWSLALGPELRGGAGRLDGRLELEPHAALAAAWLVVEGRGFQQAQRHGSLVAGAEAGLRLGLRGGRLRPLRPFLELAGCWWPGRSVAYQAPDSAETVLPAFELFMTLGIALVR